MKEKNQFALMCELVDAIDPQFEAIFTPPPSDNQISLVEPIFDPSYNVFNIFFAGTEQRKPQYPSVDKWKTPAKESAGRK